MHSLFDPVCYLLVCALMPSVCLLEHSCVLCHDVLIAHVFSMSGTLPDAAGQLAGSVTAATWASLPALTPRRDPHRPPPGPPLAMLLVSAMLLEAAGRMSTVMQCSDSLPKLAAHQKQHEDELQDLQNVPVLTRQAVSSKGHDQSQSQIKFTQRHGKDITTSMSDGHNMSSSAARHGLNQLFEGFRLISKSGYLCYVCLHFVLHYLVSTFFYFEKTLVVASSGGSASQRVATFATINSMSAGPVALIQLTATVCFGMCNHCVTMFLLAMSLLEAGL